MLQGTQFKREVARKTSVAEILESGFVKTEDGATALSVNGRQVRRASILATIVDKTDTGGAYKSMVADDGTGQIMLRLFDSESQLFERPAVGDFVMIIGKPRSYGNESYIAPEIIKPLKDVKWAEVRRLEIKALQTNATSEGIKENNAVAAAEKIGDADFVSKGKQEIYRIIKELDAGRGADMIEVVAKAASGNPERLIKEMLIAGDLFEILPGKLKVLE